MLTEDKIKKLVNIFLVRHPSDPSICGITAGEQILSVDKPASFDVDQIRAMGVSVDNSLSRVRRNALRSTFDSDSSLVQGFDDRERALALLHRILGANNTSCVSFEDRFDLGNLLKMYAIDYVDRMNFRERLIVWDAIKTHDSVTIEAMESIARRRNG